LQTMELNSHNMSRAPTLAREERISEPEEIRELFDIMRAAAPAARQCFRRLSTSGLTSLFESQGLDSSFLREETDGLYPNSEDLKPQEDGVPLCPNPWTTLFVAENGDVHLCFLSEPVGNLYEEPLAAIWNCPHALIKRSRMILGRYEESGCSAHWCSWREGKKAPPGPSEELQALREEMDELARRAAQMQPLVQIDEAAPAISAVRRKLAARNGRIQELEAMFVQLCAANGAIHKKGQRYIDQLEQRIKILEARIVDLQEQEIRHANDWRQLESETARVTAENERLRRLPAVRLAHRLARMVSWRRN
jgi:hypothetical protein